MAPRVTPAATRAGSHRITSLVPESLANDNCAKYALPAFLAVAGDEEQAPQALAGTNRTLSPRGAAKAGARVKQVTTIEIL